MQYFLRKINFLFKFISHSAEIFKQMINNDVVDKWDKREKDAFSHIKQDITNVCALFSLYDGNNFMLYNFTSDSSITTILV